MLACCVCLCACGGRSSFPARVCVSGDTWGLAMPPWEVHLLFVKDDEFYFRKLHVLPGRDSLSCFKEPGYL